MEKFCKVILIFGLIVSVIVSLLLIVFGIMLILNPGLILQIVIWAVAGICISFGVITLFSLLIKTLRGMAK